jgi:hypothetical protein
MSGDWRIWRPAIWLAMLGVAVILLVNPAYIGAIFIGAAVGVAFRIDQRRRRGASGQERKPRRRRAEVGEERKPKRRRP